MRNQENKISLKHLVSCLVMLLALSWLTVSLPVVYKSAQDLVKTSQSGVSDGDDCTNPLTNTNEEKTESGSSTLSEYLHETTHPEENYISITTFYKCHPSDLYFAYHPELNSPPPEA